MNYRTLRCQLLAAIGALPSTSACVAMDEMADHTCPPEGTLLTYDNFGKAFFAHHCVYCHGGANGYSSRALNTVENIRVQRARIFVNSAGPNTAMPPGPDDPAQADRDRLAEWLVCGAP